MTEVINQRKFISHKSLVWVSIANTSGTQAWGVLYTEQEQGVMATLLKANTTR